MSDPNDIIHMLASMRTSDRESLIQQFSRILQCNGNVAQFFLESSNWNVELAVNTFLSTFSGGAALGDPMQGDDSRAFQNTMAAMSLSADPPKAQFLCNLAPLQEGTHEPGKAIEMLWSFRNTGTRPWPADITLTLADGDAMDGPNNLKIASVGPGEQADIPVRIITPATAGAHYANWRLSCAGGYFGDPVWVILNVQESSMAMADDDSSNRERSFGHSVMSGPLSTASMGVGGRSMGEAESVQMDDAMDDL